MRDGDVTHTYSPACLRRSCLVQALRGGVTPFCGFFALLFILLEARYVAVGEEEAVA